MARILITGGNGFIGRNLVEGLQEEHTILAPSHTELDLLNEEKVYLYLITHTPQIIIHCAGIYPEGLCENLLMFLNLTKAMRNTSVDKMLYFGSGAEYDRKHWKPKMSEGYFDTYIPTDGYGLAKYMANKLTQASDNIYNLRLFGVYGKYEDAKRRFLSVCCNKVRISINKNIKFDYLFIDDLVETTKWFISNTPLHKDYNICTSQSYYLQDLAYMMADITKIPLLIDVDRANLPYNEYSGDNTRLLKEVNVKFTPIEKGVEKLYEYYTNKAKDN